MEKKTIQDWLGGFDTEFDKTDRREIKMIRHSDCRTRKGNGELRISGEPFPANIPSIKSLYLYSNDLFIKYQSEQKKCHFNQRIKYLISFLGEEKDYSRFLGVYKIIDHYPSKNGPEEIVLDLKPVNAFDSLKEKLIIEWGHNTNSWHQYYYNKKNVVKVEKEGLLKCEIDIPSSYLDVRVSYPELKKIIDDPNWKTFLEKKNCIYVILDCSNGKQYVGSTYNSNGIWGRWYPYAKTGHGDDKSLNALIEKDSKYADNNFQWSILEVLDINISESEAIEREGIWKEKLGTRKYGNYNNN